MILISTNVLISTHRCSLSFQRLHYIPWYCFTTSYLISPLLMNLGLLFSSFSLPFLFSLPLFFSLSLYLVQAVLQVNIHTDLYVLVHILLFCKRFVEIKLDQRISLLYILIEVAKLPSKIRLSIYMSGVYNVPFSPHRSHQH